MTGQFETSESTKQAMEPYIQQEFNPHWICFSVFGNYSVRSSSFWDFTQSWLVIYSPTFRKNLSVPLFKIKHSKRSHLQGLSSTLALFDLEEGTNKLSRVISKWDNKFWSLYSVQLRYTYTICFVLLGKILLHVSGWLAHHQDVRTCTVHAANWSSLCKRRVSC